MSARTINTATVIDAGHAYHGTATPQQSTTSIAKGFSASAEQTTWFRTG